MVRSHFVPLVLATLILAITFTQAGWSEDPPPLPPPPPPLEERSAPPASQPVRKGSDESKVTFTVKTENLNSRIYSLSEFGDVELGKWVADTIPQTIQPESWVQKGGAGVLSYYAPGKVLVVRQNQAVQEQVEKFLKELKQALPQPRREAATAPQVLPANMVAPASPRSADPGAGERSTYPVAPPQRQPKHLFHFIIRYEGEGIIDSNVVDYMKLSQSSDGLFSQTWVPDPGLTLPSPTNLQNYPSNGTAPGTLPPGSHTVGPVDLPSPPGGAQPAKSESPAAEPVVVNPSSARSKDSETARPAPTSPQP